MADPNGLSGIVSQPGGGGGIGDSIGGFFGDLFGNNKPDPKLMASLPYFEQDRQRLGGMLQGQSPYAGQEWGGLIHQLQQQASGQGPSLAQQAYNQASQNTVSGLSSMARGSGQAAQARQAMIQQGRVGQGMAAGLATARTQEQLGAQSALAQALNQRDSLNSNAYLSILAKQLGLSEEQLKAQLGNQQYAVGVMGSPTGVQKGLGAVGGFMSGVAQMGKGAATAGAGG